MKSIFILSLFFSLVSQSKSVEMTYTFSCGGDAEKKLCVLGKYSKNRDVVLLGRGSSKTCTAKTQDSFKYSDEALEGVNATRLSTEKECAYNSKNVAVIGVKKLNYRWLKVVTEKELPKLLPAQEKEVERFITDGFNRARKDVDYARLYFTQGDPTIQLKASSLVEGKKFKFLEYKMTCKDPNKTLLEPGPFLLITEKKILSLTPFCSTLRGFFEVDKRTYIDYSDACCNCGWHRDMISEIQGDELIPIFATMDFST